MEQLDQKQKISIMIVIMTAMLFATVSSGLILPLFTFCSAAKWRSIPKNTAQLFSKHVNPFLFCLDLISEGTAGGWPR